MTVHSASAVPGQARRRETRWASGARARPAGGAALLAIVLVACAPLQAQRGPEEESRLRQALDLLRRDNAWTLEQQVSICEIPAPPFKEAARASEFRRRLEALGLRNVRIDSEGNVIGERPGTGGGPGVVISGHLDTVFPEGTDVTVRQEGTRYHGPGIGDDCRGLAVVLAVARAFEQAGVRTPGTVYFVGTVGEEGPGNLRGVRHLFERELAGRIDYFLTIDGSGDGIASGAVGSHRYRVRYVGPGGHSYGAFGMPNPIHAMGRAIAKIADIEVPASPRTTFNVGVVEGGTSVNSIAAEGIMELDMRSPALEQLHALDARVSEALRQALEEENARWPESRTRLRLQIDTIGIRPAGTQPDSALIVRTAVAAARSLGLAATTSASSTDANVPISLGIPGIRMGGGGRGGGAHSLEEWYDDGTDGYLGPQWAAIVVTRLAQRP